VSWDPAQYLRFAGARIQPVLDLVARLAVQLSADRVIRIMDLGCGPATSTEVLAGQWPRAQVTGLDNSEEMLAAARAHFPNLRFIAGDIAAWAEAGGEPYDLVFANSSLQWLPDHAAILPKLLARVAPGGALAFQVPASVTAPVGQIPRDLAAAPAWRAYFPPGAIREWNAAPLDAYYDALAPSASHLDLWETEYIHILPGGPLDILQWYLGSGLRPFLAALPDEPLRQRFCDEYFAGLQLAYPPQSNGTVLFPFCRRFAIAQRAA